MKKMDIEIVEKGKSVDTLNNFLPNSVQTLTDDEMMEIYGGTDGCNCKNYNCKLCIHSDCVKLCKTKVFGDRTVEINPDSIFMPPVIVVR